MINWIKNQQDLENLKRMTESYIKHTQNEIESHLYEEDYSRVSDLSSDLKVLSNFRTDIKGVDDLKIINELIDELSETADLSSQWWYDRIMREFEDEFRKRNAKVRAFWAGERYWG